MDCKMDKVFCCGHLYLSQVDIEITFETTGIAIDMPEIQTELQLSTYGKDMNEFTF